MSLVVQRSLVGLVSVPSVGRLSPVTFPNEASFKSTAVLATLRREDGGLDGLESDILEKLTDDPSKNGVEEIVARAIGEDSVDPWGGVIYMSKEHLLTRGYFKEARQGRLGGLIGEAGPRTQLREDRPTKRADTIGTGATPIPRLGSR